MELFYYFILIGLTFGVFNYFIAKEKNRDPIGWFIIGLLFNLISLIALIALPKLEKEPSEEDEEYTCPDCDTDVGEDDIFCPNCGLEFIEPEDFEINQEKCCANCGKQLIPNTKFCSSCGTKITQS